MNPSGTCTKFPGSFSRSFSIFQMTHLFSATCFAVCIWEFASEIRRSNSLYFSPLDCCQPKFFAYFLPAISSFAISSFLLHHHSTFNNVVLSFVAVLSGWTFLQNVPSKVEPPSHASCSYPRNIPNPLRPPSATTSSTHCIFR
jgi:hypothetical protein